MSRPLDRLIAGYRAAAIVLLNTLIGFVLLNAVFFVASSALEYGRRRQHPGRTSPVCPFYGDTLAGMYPGYSRADIDEILDETWSRPVLYEPYVQFTERPFSGKYVNVTGDGYRRTTNQGPWPPHRENINVFLFGGSTVFNYGVADADTIASFLQEQLDGLAGRPVRVYNFGRGSYY